MECGASSRTQMIRKPSSRSSRSRRRTTGLQREDAARLAALPAALRESGDGQYVDALFSLRFGDPSTAAATLANAAPQPDGAHLYFGAMAELMRADGAPDGRAKALLEQLRRDYPKSSLARHAGSFIRQLSPR